MEQETGNGMSRGVHPSHLDHCMDVYSSLAGGIAHDVNNLLGGVLAHAESGLNELAGGSSPEHALQSIRTVAIRGSEIVRQLMIYAGRESEHPELVDVSQLVQEMIELLNAVVSKHAIVEADLGKNLRVVRANPAQLRQMVMNLIMNASQAIGDRDGLIRITTGQVTLTRQSPEAISHRLPEGDYLRLQVSDTGCGMTPDTQARIFEPFYTTRRTGHGLGLSVIRGVVRSLHGSMHLVSAPGAGTTFQILLPCEGYPAVATGALHSPAEAEELVTPVTILVVEDEGALRLPIVTQLRIAGFTILEAGDGFTALDLIRAHKDCIDVLLLDVSLPGVSSSQVFDAARLQSPAMAVILTSAYCRQAAAASFAAPVKHFIRKPYRLVELLKLIRHAAQCANI